MADNTPKKLEHSTERATKKKGKGKGKTVKITVEFDQDAVTDGLTSLVGKISDLVR